MHRNYSGGEGLGHHRGSLGGRYFTQFTLSKALLYASALLYVVSVCVLAVLEPWIVLPCDNVEPSNSTDYYTPENPAYKVNPCRHEARFGRLLWLTRVEYAYVRRLVASVLMGGVIGWERRQADRPAGIRTMSLVSLGSALFTIDSTHAFLSGPMNWDASRVSAAIPSGVGFLGAGLIFKEQSTAEDGTSTTHVVHGLTTAASLWLSAAVGIACGGGLYVPASFGMSIMLLLLRFGPRHSDMENSSDEDHEPVGGGGDEEDHSPSENQEMSQYSSVHDSKHLHDEPSETDSLISAKKKQISIRSRASLASVV